MKDDPSSKTVYFLGAGASKASDFELPAMTGFFREEDFDSKGYSNLHKFIKENFPNISFKELNLEEMVTCLELSLDKFSSFGEHPEVYLYEARREFDKYVNIRLEIPNKKGCNKFKNLFKDLTEFESKDTVITINYDLVVDNTLWELSPKEGIEGELKMKHGCLLDRMYGLLGVTRLIHGDRPSLYPQDKNKGFYLKLHGSIDWLYCPNQTCGNHQLFFPNWIDSSEVHNVPGDLCSLCGSPLVSVIIPPTMHKSFENFPKLGLLWSLAYRELKQADKIIMIGVSLVESDYYLNWLIRSAIRASENNSQVEVVNKEGRKEEIFEKIKKLTGITPKYQGDLDEYIEKIKTN